MDRTTVAAEQLRRMRGMTRYYHQRFFADIRFTTGAVVGLLLIGWWGVTEAFLLIPFLTLIGANQTAFDASYLHFARHYAATLERDLNQGLRRKVLVAAELEDHYLYPLNRPKVVTAHLGSGFSWFGWMTILYTVVGVMSFAGGLALGWPTLRAAGTSWTVSYLVAVAVLVVASLAIGGWWFLAGAGESRLRSVLASSYGETLTNSSPST